MIWKTEHITQAVRNTQTFIQSFINRQTVLTTESDLSFDIGIVGGGPKGLYALEELFRNLKKGKTQGKFRVFWWNETHNFGSGPNYQPDQPDYLLINYCIGHVDAWDRTQDNNKELLSLVHWLEKTKNNQVKVQPTDFASRALVGYYLQNVLIEIIKSKPETIELFLIPEKVCNIQKLANAKLMVHTHNKEYVVDNLLLTTGHCYQNTPLVNFGDNHIPENYLPSAYPIQVLKKIPPKKNVGIIGWGLTFIDVVLALTEGRGGTFDDHGNYIANGIEPVLLPFSRNQLPIMPRGPIYGKNTYQLYYLDENWFQLMKSISKERKIDFRNDIFPWLEKELSFAYYSTFLQTREVSKVEKHIESLPESKKFTYKDLLFPKMPTSATAQETYIRYIEYLIDEAEKGELKSPLMAATAVWREASPLIADLYKTGGFTGESQYYLDKELFGAFCRTSYGSPIENMKKILALLKANVIKTQWLNKTEVIYNKNEPHFLLRSKEYTEKVDFIVDARIARPELKQNNSRLYKTLYENNMVNPFENEGYTPGCVAMDVTGKVIHKDNLHLYFYGTNTEGVMLDNDSLSRKKNNLAPHWVTGILKQYRMLNKSSTNKILDKNEYS